MATFVSELQKQQVVAFLEGVREGVTAYDDADGRFESLSEVIDALKAATVVEQSQELFARPTLATAPSQTPRCTHGTALAYWCEKCVRDIVDRATMTTQFTYTNEVRDEMWRQQREVATPDAVGEADGKAVRAAQLEETISRLAQIGAPASDMAAITRARQHLEKVRAGINRIERALDSRA